MDPILRICFPSTLRVVAQHAEVLTFCLDLTPNILKQPTFHDWVHYSLKIDSLSTCVPLTLRVTAQYTEVLTVELNLTHDWVHYPLKIESLCKLKS